MSGDYVRVDFSITTHDKSRGVNGDVKCPSVRVKEVFCSRSFLRVENRSPKHEI